MGSKCWITGGHHLGLYEPVSLPDDVLVVRVVEEVAGPHRPGVLVQGVGYLHPEQSQSQYSDNPSQDITLSSHLPSVCAPMMAAVSLPLKPN